MTWRTVDATPLVVEKLGDIVSRRQRLPSASRWPPHRSTTHSPRWYTHTAAPPGWLASWRSSAAATGMKPGCTNPSIGTERGVEPRERPRRNGTVTAP
jgi:hypothetical protein